MYHWVLHCFKCYLNTVLIWLYSLPFSLPMSMLRYRDVTNPFSRYTVFPFLSYHFCSIFILIDIWVYYKQYRWGDSLAYLFQHTKQSLSRNKIAGSFCTRVLYFYTYCLITVQIKYTNLCSYHSCLGFGRASHLYQTFQLYLVIIFSTFSHIANEVDHLCSFFFFFFGWCVHFLAK